MADNNQNPNPNELNIELPEEIAEGTYSNLAIITHSHAEFIIDFVKLINRGIEQGRSQATLLGQGKGKSGIGIGHSDGSSPAINGGDGMHVPIKDPYLAVLGALGMAGPKPGPKGRGKHPQ